MPIEVFREIEQGSEQWRRVRCGLPTASMFKAILAKGEGKTRKSYLYRLASEIITGEPMESFTNGSTERGHAMEAEARNFYSYLVDAEPELVGFVRNGPRGASPDSFIGSDGLLEIKTQRGDLLIETLFKGEFPSEHVTQVQGQLWVTERSWCDLIVYWPGMPPFIKRAYRNDHFIADLERAVDQFNDELASIVAKVQSYSSGGIARAA